MSPDWQTAHGYGAPQRALRESAAVIRQPSCAGADAACFFGCVAKWHRRADLGGGLCLRRSATERTLIYGWPPPMGLVSSQPTLPGALGAFAPASAGGMACVSASAMTPNCTEPPPALIRSTIWDCPGRFHCGAREGPLRLFAARSPGPTAGASPCLGTDGAIGNAAHRPRCWCRPSYDHGIPRQWLRSPPARPG